MTALTLGQRKDNLPAEMTRFIGRRRELPVLAAAIEHNRLVTLRGAGGVGKTRLALRAARDARPGFADGCWLVELSGLRTAELLARTVSGALGLPDEAPGDALDMLAASLAERELLLVLDSCEHLAGACADLVRVLLGAAPRLHILATSREPLGVPDEHTLLVTPLELPADDTLAAYSDAVTLFVDRARAAVPDFALTPSRTAAVIELCRRLDGIPLALELAAVRLRGMPVEQVLARLTDRFRILGAARTTNGRHRTLRAAVAWSYELCTAAEQRLWAELSVFPGTFSLDAVEYVCGPGSAQTLTGLAEKSLVVSSPTAGRYYLPGTMREFGAELLSTGRPGTRPQAGTEQLRRRHRDYYLRLAGQACAGSLSAAQTSWLARLSEETGNIRAALGYSFGTPGQQRPGLLMTTVLRPYWLMTGQFSEARRWHELAVQVDPGSRENAWAVYGAGLFAVQQGDLAAGAPLLESAAAMATGSGDEDLAAHVTEGRGMVACYSGDLPAATAQYEAALAAYQRLGFTDPPALAGYSRLASVCLLSRELNRALGLCEECLRRCDALGDQWARGIALWVRGAARWLSGDLAAAIEDARACLRIRDPAGDPQTIAMSFDLLAVCLAAVGESERAAVLYGAGDTLWTLLGAPVLMGPAYTGIRGAAAEAVRARLGAERFEELAKRGHELPLPAAIAIAAGEAAVVPDNGVSSLDGSAGAPLTRREQEIARLVAAGLANREIAQRLYLSKRTVDSHLEHIFAKLGFSARTQLASWVRACGELSRGTLRNPLPLIVTVTFLPAFPYLGEMHLLQLPIFIKIGGRYLPARHPTFTGGRQSLRMSDDPGSGLSRRQMLAASGTGLLAATATAGPARAAARGRTAVADGTPEQVHLTWGDDPARSVVISWVSPGQAVRPRVRIGQRVIHAAERAHTDALSGEVTWTYHARVGRLRPGATYGYAVTSDNDRNSADPFSATFTTAPDGRAGFRFTSFGDLATPNPRWVNSYGQAAYAVAAVETFQPLFHLLNGDLAYADLNPVAQPKVWRDFGGNAQASAAYRPWMPVPGNHELEFGNDAEGFAAYLARYSLPGNGSGRFEGHWYSFRIGTVVFVCLSGNDVAFQDAGAFVAGPEPLEPAADGAEPVPAGTSRYVRGYSGGAQTRWLEATLKAARGDATVDWVIVQVHQCACSSVPWGNGSDLGLRQEWLPLFDRYEVDLVLSGHDHGYERSFPVRGFDAAVGTDAVTGAPAETRRPHPVTTADSGVFDTSQGTVHLVLGCGGSASPLDGRASGSGSGGTTDDITAGSTGGSSGGTTGGSPVAMVFTRPNHPVPATTPPGPHGSWIRPAADAVEPATWSARRDTATEYGVAVFDLNPGTEAGGQTSITVRYYHAVGAGPAGAPTGDYTLFETFTLVRPRSDGRRWYARPAPAQPAPRPGPGPDTV